MGKLWFHAPLHQNPVSLGPWKKYLFLATTFITDIWTSPHLLLQLYSAKPAISQFSSDKSRKGAEVHFWIISPENPVTRVRRGWKSFIWKNPDLVTAQWIVWYNATFPSLASPCYTLPQHPNLPLSMSNDIKGKSLFPCDFNVYLGCKPDPTQYNELFCTVQAKCRCQLPFDTVSAGDHCDLKMSRQMLPLLFMFGW